MSLFFPNAYANPLGRKGNAAGIASATLVHGVIFAIIALGLGQSEALTEIARPLAVRLVEAVQTREAPPQPPPPSQKRQPKFQPKVVEAPVLTSAAATEESSFVVAEQPPAPPIAAEIPAPAPVVETLVEARFDADYLANPKPPYPSASRRLSEAGTVLLRVHVGPDGLAQKVELKRSCGFKRLDHSALETVAQWRFVPAKRGNAAIASWVVVPIVFSLT